MSGKASFTEGDHGPAILEGVTTALSWLSILPLRGATAFDRITGARAMASIPIVGVVFGLFSAVLLVLLGLLGVSSLLSAVLVVMLWELLNRMMHLDGLADVGDALGSYAPPERAREILADPQTGLIGFTAALFSLSVQIAGVAALIDHAAVWMVCFIPAICRLGGQVVARAGRLPLSPTGFGAMVVGTVRLWWVGAWWLVISTAAVLTAVLTAVPGDGNTGWSLAWVVPVAGLAACVTSEGAARHLSRRFNGVNGDCIGACIHISAALGTALCAIAVSGVSTLS